MSPAGPMDFLNNPYIRLDIPEQAHIAMARALSTQRERLVKLMRSHGFELINSKIALYLSNIGLVYKLIERLMTPFQEL